MCDAHRIAPGASMKPNRRKFLKMAACAAALPLPRATAWAQTYPARPVRVVVPVAAGGANDVTGRSIGQWLSEARPAVRHREPSGRRDQYRHRGGLRSTADGYTLLISGSNAAINPSLFRRSTSISSATPRRSAASCACRSSCRSILSRSRQKRSRVHRLRQGQSRQGRDGLRRQRLAGACRSGNISS